MPLLSCAIVCEADFDAYLECGNVISSAIAGTMLRRSSGGTCSASTLMPPPVDHGDHEHGRVLRIRSMPGGALMRAPDLASSHRVPLCRLF